MNDTEYDAWLAERKWRRGQENCNSGMWQVYADNGWGDLGGVGSYRTGDTSVAGYGKTLAEARAAARCRIEEREALRAGGGVASPGARG